MLSLESGFRHSLTPPPLSLPELGAKPRDLLCALPARKCRLPHISISTPQSPPSRRPRSPRPLKIEPPKLPCHINHLSDEVKPWNLAAFHRPCAQLGSVHSARRDFSLLIPFRPGRIDSPAMKGALRLLESLVRP